MDNELDVTTIRGLTEQEAEDRLARDGFNELPSSKPRSVFAIAFSVMREPMFLLLVAGGLIYLFLGDLQEALMLLAFVLVVIGITFYQERKTERALEALRDLSSPRALVIRDGKQERIAGRDVVRDDITVLSEGDRVPADGLLLYNNNLTVDESLLTGESVPVRKTARLDVVEIARPGGEDTAFVYSGTLIVQGQGIARVMSTGVQTEIGRIGTTIQSIKPENTPLQKETRRLVLNLAVVGLVLCAVVVIAYGLTRGNWINGFLAGIALAMAILPEEFPVVLTVFLALGAWRIAQNRVLTRQMPAVETLGAATVLCVDKTGTLTLNQMSVAQLLADSTTIDLIEGNRKSLPETFHELVEYSILASQRDPFDPMERAIKQLGDRFLARTEHIHYNWTLVCEYPLSKSLLAMSHVWTSPDKSEYIIAAKGSPEAIADLCHFDKAQLSELMGKVSQMADNGLRVLGVAKARFQPSELPGQQHDFWFEFEGLIGLADPVRPTVPDAISECYDAGIRVIMITGDYPGTALNIARQIGLSSDGYITGSELNDMSNADLKRRIRHINIFARVVPEQKHRIVNALKANGEIVAMTGDGVNDAPALKAAHIGIAMGGRGTDVARESAALVLLDDDFSSIVQAVKMGRRIFDNLKKASTYILAVHVPIAGMSLIPVLLGWPLVLLPMHIAFLELIIDPACSVAFEAEPAEANIMDRPPRNPSAPLYGRKMIKLSVLQGTSVLAVLLAVFGIARLLDFGTTDARALTFAILIIANIGLILTNRSISVTLRSLFRPGNPALWWIVGGAMVFLGFLLFVPWLRGLFRFGTLSFLQILFCLAVGGLLIVWFEILKNLVFHEDANG